MNNDLTLEMLKASATTDDKALEWNQWLITNINDLGLIHVSPDYDLIHPLSGSFLALFLLYNLYLAFRWLKKVFEENREHIIAEINSCCRFYMDAFLDNKEFRNWTLKFASWMLIISSICGAVIGSAMFGFIVGSGLLCSLLHNIYVDKHTQETRLN